MTKLEEILRASTSIKWDTIDHRIGKKDATHYWNANNLIQLFLECRNKEADPVIKEHYNDLVNAMQILKRTLSEK